MIDNIKKISNPLTIIAIFAGLAEIAGTVAIKLVEPQYQGTFIWFVMLFPTTLVLLFFFVLFTKPHVLYSPSDFRADESYISIQKGLVDFVKNKNIEDKISKISSFDNTTPQIQNILSKISVEAKKIIVAMSEKSNSVSQQIEMVEQILFDSKEFNDLNKEWKKEMKIILSAGYLLGLINNFGKTLLGLKNDGEDKYMLGVPSDILVQFKKEIAN